MTAPGETRPIWLREDDPSTNISGFSASASSCSAPADDRLAANGRVSTGGVGPGAPAIFAAARCSASSVPE